MDLVEMSVTASEYRDLDRRWAQRLAVEKAALQTEIARLRRELTARGLAHVANPPKDT